MPDLPIAALPDRLREQALAALDHARNRSRRAVGLGAAALVAVALLLSWWVTRSPAPVAVTERPGTPFPAGSGSPAASASPGASRDVVVHVAGKVARPGVVHLAAGARVLDAIAAAGGLLPGVDPSGVNLARPVTDGEQILVGAPADAVAGAAAPGSSPGSSPAAGRPLDLNRATADQLDALPGVGPVLAARIVEWRSAHGRFASLDQLREVSGIGEAKFRDLSPLLRVG